MSVKFGTSGLRGLASELESSIATIHARAFAEHLIAQNQIKSGDLVYVGRDLRKSSPAIADLCAEGLRQAGLIPADCGAVPTPCLANFAIGKEVAAIIVTGSHIPEDRNGIKFYRPDGEIDKHDEAEIAARASHLTSIATPLKLTSSTMIIEEKAVSVFKERLERLLPADALQGLRVGVYEHSSVGRDILREILQHYGTHTISLDRSETFIAVDTEAVDPATTVRLASWANDFQLDAIVSTDGDADRPMLADENGALVPGDIIGLLTSEFLGATRVVTPVTSNSGIKAGSRFSVERTRVGSPYVIQQMGNNSHENEIVVGFEANGGVLLGSPCILNGNQIDALPTRDCFLPLLAVLFAAKQQGCGISKLVASRDLPVTHSDRLKDFPSEVAEQFLGILSKDEAFANAQFAKISPIKTLDLTDGVRFTLSDKSIVHFRMSGNAPELRCYAEAKTISSARNLVHQALELALAFAGKC